MKVFAPKSATAPSAKTLAASTGDTATTSK